MVLVPPIAVFLAKHPIVDQYDLSSLQSLTSAAAPLGQDIIEKVKQRANLKEFKQCKCFSLLCQKRFSNAPH